MAYRVEHLRVMPGQADPVRQAHRRDPGHLPAKSGTRTVAT